MKKVYRSKISLSVVIPFGLLIVAILILMLVQGAWPGVLIVVIVLSFVVHLFVNTYYTIDGDKLYVKAGFLVDIEIDVAQITKIIPTNSVLSAPAMSFNRIEVFYNKWDTVVISPGDNEGFIAKLKAVNPAIFTALI